MQTGSESTVYTTYNEYPGMYYPMPGYTQGYSRSNSKHKPRVSINPYSYR